MMRKINRTIAATIVATAVAGGFYGFLGSSMVPTADARLKDHPQLEAAHIALKEAKEELEATDHNFHGHKEAALRAIDHAMREIYVCADEVDRRGTPDSRHLGEYHKLHHAKDKLKDARDYLNGAKHDFHGHKASAIEALDAAIHHINVCLED